MEVFNLKDKLHFLREVAELTQKEWGSKNITDEEFEQKVNHKMDKIKSLLDDNRYCKLLLIENGTLIGFISMFPTDGDERQDLTPWYATMYVKEEYRGKGYSKILNDAILEEARSRGFKKLYLKSELINYYEKFGAKYMETLSNGEKLFYIEI